MGECYQNQKESLYVVGHPVAHSKSPVMHNAVYEALGFPWTYECKDCADEHEARTFFNTASWLALNITMPYKPLALQSATCATEYAQIAQGANVLIRTTAGIYADNTDGRGCISYLERCGCVFENARVIICGTGPTAQSIMFAAAKAGATSVGLLSRTLEKAEAQLGVFMHQLDDARLAARIFASSYKVAADKIETADIIIDATPLGMHQNDPAPFDSALLHAGQTVFDVVYGHGLTALIAAARKRGCKAVDGSGMLVAQAVQTVFDIQEVLNIPISLDASELFTIMAKAAGFSDCL